MKKQTSLLIIAIITAMVAACSCSRKIYVPVERLVVHHDSSLTTALRIDTLVHKDSVIIARSGDTVYHTAWRLRERVSRHRDTIVRIVHDTIVVTRTTVADPSPAPLVSRLHRTLTTLLAISVAVLLIAFTIRYIYRRAKRRTP